MVENEFGKKFGDKSILKNGGQIPFKEKKQMRSKMLLLTVEYHKSLA